MDAKYKGFTVNDCTRLHDALEKWEGTWGMYFNPSKCNIIHVSRKKKPLLYTYHIKSTNLKAVDIATYLGIEVSKELTWHKQVSKVAAKENRVLRFVRLNITTTSQCIKELAYKTLVRRNRPLSGVLITRNLRGPLKWFSVMRPVLYCIATKERPLSLT